ncbi:protein TIFY 6B isoform X2 [Herrania umbratica]|uniref:Protein TIFY n=1 Tax=Herrania umbratica TaxID=108875 RepID=A0A6J1AYE2_9ROSI|nr:protein TIFY 6B isoform X2 [Herrania umbratica]
MERDFMGLGSKHAPVTVKEEACEGLKDSVFLRGSGMQLSFSNKVSAVPQFLSFKAAQEDRPRKAAHDPLVSSGFMAKPTADSNPRPYSGLTQKQEGNHYTVTTFGLQQFDGHQPHLSQEVRLFPVSSQPNQTITVSMSTPLLQSHLVSTGQNTIGNTVTPQPFAGVPIMAPPVSVVPPSSSIIGTTELRNAAKSSQAPSQLTIFYAGSVCVFDDVSPEKAQAIMLLAGNGSSAAQSKSTPMTQAQAPMPRPCTADGFVGNNSSTMSPCSGFPGPISVTSYVSLQPGGGSSGTNDLTAATRVGAITSSSNQPEPPKVVNSVGSATSLIPAAVPQARKASLARFLEKRKERVTNTSPYYISKKSPGSDDISFSVASAGSSPLPAIN